MDVSNKCLSMITKILRSSTAIARIDRLGQTRPTEGQEPCNLDTIATYFHYFRHSILLLC